MRALNAGASGFFGRRLASTLSHRPRSTERDPVRRAVMEAGLKAGPKRGRVGVRAR